MSIQPATTVDFFLGGLEAFMRRSGQGTHWGVTVLRLEGRPDAQILTQGWKQIHAMHPMLGARLKRQWRGWRWVWETAGPIAAPPICWHAAQPLPPDAAVIQERLQGRSSTGELSTPLWMEVFPWGADGGHVILLSWRHALLDGTGINLLLEKLAAGGCASGPPLLTAPPSETPAQLYKRARPLMNRLQAMTTAGCLSAWMKGMPIGGRPEYRLIELSHEESGKAVARLRALCGDFMQMPFYAAVAARALRLLHERREWSSPEIHLHLPMQLRGRSRELIFGNHMGAMPLFLDAGELSTLEQTVAHLLEKYREAMKEGMPQASEALTKLAAHFPLSTFIPMVRWTNMGQICSLFHSHTGAFLPGRTEFAGAAVQNVFTIPSVCAPPGLGIFVSDYAGQITVTLAWRGDGVSQAEIEAMAQRIRTDLTGIAEQ
ncbi:hypothetical protein [Prosthecobacter sp.]|uniref:hypothetical protein n=1 Tax=Prosthecobacter sp. TaxID=1965333 RepID=UPI002487DA0D|nr:hypothetical protein [Prosthecobacter sp.]MDI1311004.1 hypothetical protein [Prosthecobacter sp.]